MTHVTHQKNNQYHKIKDNTVQSHKGTRKTYKQHTVQRIKQDRYLTNDQSQTIQHDNTTDA